MSRDRVRALLGTITRRRLVRWYLCVVVTLTVLSGALHGLIAPPMGLVRTFYATSGFSGEPLSQDRTTEISLAFLDQDPTLPRRFISVEWRGFWFLPQAQTVDVVRRGRTTASTCWWMASSSSSAALAWACTRLVRRSH